MSSVNRSALIDYSVEQMFALVNDIEKYPLFMQGCKSATVISRTDDVLVGELVLSKAGISQRFTTRNQLYPPTHIIMALVKGNFSHFRARWQFDALSASACKVSLTMDFEFKFGLVDFAAKKLFSGSTDNLVDSLVTRAKQVYG
jgi:ribosome-associated toxin RatA of RatAB toxin-antitoxin module